MGNGSLDGASGGLDVDGGTLAAHSSDSSW